MNYTHVEMTEKKYTYHKAVKNAGLLYKGNLCLNAIQPYSETHLFTLEEINLLVDEMVCDSKFYSI